MTIILIFILFFNIEIFAYDFAFTEIDETLFITNEKNVLNSIIFSPGVYNGVKKQPQLSLAEIFYGIYENYGANISFVKEFQNRGISISYKRERIENYSSEGKKVYNSSFDFDRFDASFSYLGLNDISLNLDIKYDYFSRGLMQNIFYDIQNKRLVMFEPEFKYFLSDNSSFLSKIWYKEIFNQFEGKTNIIVSRANNFKTFLFYEKIWSEINSFSFGIDLFQYNLNYYDRKIMNTIATILAKEKFALSRITVLNFEANMIFNKKYNPVFAGIIKMILNFKKFKVITSFERKYYPEKFNQIIEINYFTKLKENIFPEIQTGLLTGINAEIFRNIIFELEGEYFFIKNFVHQIEDQDKLFYLKNINLYSAQINTKLNYFLSELLNISFTYQYIPYLSKDVSFIAKNTITTAFEINYKRFLLKAILKYVDIRNYIDYTYSVKTLNSYICFNLEFLYYLHQNIALKFLCENIANNTIYKIANYPEPENIYKMGLYAKF